MVLVIRNKDVNPAGRWYMFYTYAENQNKHSGSNVYRLSAVCSCDLSALTWICVSNPDQHGLKYEHNGRHTYDSQEYTEFWFYDIA